MKDKSKKMKENSKLRVSPTPSTSAFISRLKEETESVITASNGGGKSPESRFGGAMSTKSAGKAMSVADLMKENPKTAKKIFLDDVSLRSFAGDR